MQGNVYVFKTNSQQWRAIEQDKKNFDQHGLSLKKFGRNWRVLASAGGVAPMLAMFLTNRGFDVKLANGLFVAGNGAEIQTAVTDFFEKWEQVSKQDEREKETV